MAQLAYPERAIADKAPGSTENDTDEKASVEADQDDASDPGEYQPPRNYKEADALATQLPSVDGFLKVTFKGGRHWVHEGTGDACEYLIEMDVDSPACSFSEFNASDIDEPLNEVIAERLEKYECHFMDIAEKFRNWKPETKEQTAFEQLPHDSAKLAELTTDSR